jgi:hypothetical protein
MIPTVAPDNGDSSRASRENLLRLLSWQDLNFGTQEGWTTEQEERGSEAKPIHSRCFHSLVGLRSAHF